MDSHKENDAIAELSRAITFKADLHLLHLRAAFHEHIGDVPSALRDCRAALSLDPNHQEMLELQKRVNSQEPWRTVVLYCVLVYHVGAPHDSLNLIHCSWFDS